MDKATIGAILRNRIKECNYTQEEFAEEVGIGLSSLKSYMSGKNAYSYELLLLFAEKLNCSYDYLLGLTKTANPEHREIRDKINLSDGAIDILIQKTKESKSEDIQSYYMKTLDELITNEAIIDDITYYFATTKTTANFMNNVLNLNKQEYKLPFGNDLYVLVAIISELKDIKNELAQKVNKDFNQVLESIDVDSLLESLSNKAESN